MGVEAAFTFLWYWRLGTRCSELCTHRRVYWEVQMCVHEIHGDLQRKRHQHKSPARVLENPAGQGLLRLTLVYFSSAAFQDWPRWGPQGIPWGRGQGAEARNPPFSSKGAQNPTRFGWETRDISPQQQALLQTCGHSGHLHVHKCHSKPSRKRNTLPMKV